MPEQLPAPRRTLTEELAAIAKLAEAVGTAYGRQIRAMAKVGAAIGRLLEARRSPDSIYQRRASRARERSRRNTAAGPRRPRHGRTTR